MFSIIVCLAGVFAVLLIGEVLDKRKKLTGDTKRQFIHIAAGSVIAFWPWLISFNAIAVLGGLMLLAVLVNRRKLLADIYTKIDRKSYGDVFYALAVIVTALITDEKIFFALAILIMALGDGLANLIGQRYGKNWRYKVFGHNKTVIGSMAMWMAALLVLAMGMFFANNLIEYSAYTTLILIIPPLLVLVENIGIYGLDNLLVPAVVAAALNLAK